MYFSTSGCRAANSYTALVTSGGRADALMPGGSGGRSGAICTIVCGGGGGTLAVCVAGGAPVFWSHATASATAKTAGAMRTIRRDGMTRFYHLAVHWADARGPLWLACLASLSSSPPRRAPGIFCAPARSVVSGRGGPFLALLLQDVSGEIQAKVFQDVETASEQFEAGEFVAVQGHGNLVPRARRARARQDPARHSRRRVARVSRGRLHSVLAAQRRRDVAGALQPARERRATRSCASS